MTIHDLVAMAKRIHDAEGWALGTASTRDTRNAFWARVVGCAHHGHPEYNVTPDPQWHLKSAGGGRPQSDDVAVSMPSRAYWDCIAGVGAEGYQFIATGHVEPLPLEQEVFVPPVPRGTTGGGTGGGGGTPTTPTVALSPVLSKLDQLETLIDRLSAQLTTAHADTANRLDAVQGKVDAAAHDAGVAAREVLIVKDWLAQGLAVSLSARFLGTVSGTVRAPQ